MEVNSVVFIKFDMICLKKHLHTQITFYCMRLFSFISLLERSQRDTSKFKALDGQVSLSPRIDRNIRQGAK